MQVQPHSPPELLASYAARPDRYDELCQRIGSVVVVRPHWRDFFHGLAAMPADELSARRAALGRQIHENGITYNVYADPRGFARPWELDLLPYMLPAAEWAQIEAAVIQRATLFDRILADLYGEQTLLEKGLVPPALIYGHSGFLRPLVGARPAGGRFLHLYAVDLARSPDGRWWVVADRTQAPSGAGYALENRSVVARVLPELYRAAGVEPLVPFFEGFRDGLADLAPADSAAAGEDPLIVVLTPGPYNETYFEHAYLARELGFPLVEGQDLTVRDDKVWLRTLDGLRRVHVILRRVDDLWCDPLELREDSALGVAGLVAAVRAGTVTVANALGSGILETGALLGYLPRLCEHLLGNKLRMPSVATWWCGEAAACDYALKHLRELVIKPAYPTLGAGPVFCGDLPAAELDALAARIALRPFDFVAQEMVNISQAPVLAGGEGREGGGGKDAPGREARALVARNIGLRVFAAAGAEGFRVLPGGLVRVASEADMRIVSMQHGGGSKDAWVLGSPARPRPLPRIVPGQLARMARQAAPLQIGRAGHQQRAGVAQRPGDVGVGRRLGVADGQVEPLLRQIHQPVRKIQVDADFRKARHEGGQRGRDVLAPQRHRRRHAHQAARVVGLLAHAAEAVLDLRERGLHVVHQLRAGFRQADRARGAAHQRHAGGALQLGDAHTDRGLGDAEPPCRGGVAARLRQHGEQVQVGELGQGIGGAHGAGGLQLFRELNNVVKNRRAAKRATA